jgi:membrane-bound lytic murein transglycosylase D
LQLQHDSHPATGHDRDWKRRRARRRRRRGLRPGALGFTVVLAGLLTGCGHRAATNPPAVAGAQVADAEAAKTAAATAPSGAPDTAATAMPAPATNTSASGAATAGGGSAESSAPAGSQGAQAAPAATETQRSSASSDAAAALAAAAEADYRRGLDLYQAGHIDDARAAFDQAVSRLLSSNLDVRDTPLLSAKLESLVDRIHALEVEALQQGDGFTEQPLEAAPIEAVAQLTFPEDAEARAEVENKIVARSGDLPLQLTDPVIQYIHYFSHGGREYLEDGFRHAGRYRPMIERVLRQEGLPQDLIYLAQAESSFRPRDVSHKGADGIWQFMASRADDYGLKRDWWEDERQDPEKSTVAAARHLRDLYREFGDWYLAMAAYDSGPGTIERAVARTGYADFWQLYRRGVLPHETRNYVPIIIAIALIAKNPQQYGLNQIQEDAPLQYDEVTLDAPLDLRLAAECANTTLDEIQSLNPSLLRLAAPTGFDLKIPPGTRERFDDAIALIPPEKRVLWRYHHVEPGETLAEIAHRYHSTTAEIVQVNQIENDRLLTPGEALVIPVSGEVRTRTVRYRVHSGDTLSAVARRFGVTQTELRRWNHLRMTRLHPGRVVYVHVTGPVPEGGDSRIRHSYRRKPSSRHRRKRATKRASKAHKTKA